MDNNSEVIQQLRKSMEFYRELGFQYLPVKTTDIAEDLEKIFDTGKEGDSNFDISNKGETLKRLREEMGGCQLCKLLNGRKNIVFGEGNPDAKLMFIGEGPGRDEDIQARPFVGAAGQLLTNLIKKMGLKREDVYIANIVKCRPPGNRNPEEDEITACKPFLERQIEIIKPKVIFNLGRISAQSLLRTNVPISKLRGHFFVFQDVPVMPTFHPAYLLRNPKDKWLTWEDAQKVLEKLNK